MPEAREGLGNFLTDTIREVVREELAGAHKAGKLIKKPRIYNDLLSSQPLTFNLFGELKRDLALATRWARHVWPGRVDDVTAIEIEHSPGRGSEKYLENKSAFDAYIEHTNPAGANGFIGVEVKYHENLDVKVAEVRTRALQVAKESGAFELGSQDDLMRPPLQQFFLDHLLALSMLQAGEGWTSGLFVVLAPMANTACRRLVPDYESCLAVTSSFQSLTLEDAVAALMLVTDAQWPRDFHRRYLDYDRASSAGDSP